MSSDSDKTKVDTIPVPVDGPAQPKAEIEQVEQDREDDREKVQWPFTQGTGRIPFMYFDVHSVADFIDDEENETGKILMAMMSEIIYLKGLVADLLKERQQESFEAWLSTQGKKLRRR
jgi:hypothetical protein